MPKSMTRQIIGGGKYGRESYGCTVTFRNDNGDLLAMYRFGPPIQGLRDMCDEAISRDATFRVVAYSTPQTIFGDLQGGRADYVSGEGRRLQRATPEQAVLSKIGRADLCHPGLLAHMRPTDNRTVEAER